MKHYGDIKQISGYDVPLTDVVIGGSPCFPAGNLVQTASGMKPIEAVQIGDLVLTHTNQYQTVEKIGHQQAEKLIAIHIFGSPEIIATPEHPFYVRTKEKRQISPECRSAVILKQDSHWVQAKELTKDCCIAFPIDQNSINKEKLTKHECYLLGRFVASGKIEDGKTAVFDVKQSELASFQVMIKRMKGVETEFRDNGYCCRITDEKLLNLCIKCRHSDAIPQFIIELPKQYLRNFFVGYIFDEWFESSLGQIEIMEYSKTIAYQLRQIIAKTYCTYGKIKFKNNRYFLEFSTVYRKNFGYFYENGMLWIPFQSFEYLNDTDIVYNLQVQEDNSYTVNNFAVHNCQDLSIAGKRAGLAGERSGLFTEQIRVIKEMREAGGVPRYMVWENVCFTGDTLVTCQDGYKEIKDIQIGDMVKTHAGQYKSVERLIQTENQKIMRICTADNNEIYATPEHPFFAVRQNQDGSYSNPEIIKAEDLDSNYMIGYKIDVPALPNDTISKAQAWLIGKWLSNSIIKFENENQFIIYLNLLYDYNATKEKLQKLHYNYEEQNITAFGEDIVFTSDEFSNLVSDSKMGTEVPPFIFNLPYHLQEAVLEGYLHDAKASYYNLDSEVIKTKQGKLLTYGIARLIRNVYHINPFFKPLNEDKTLYELQIHFILDPKEGIHYNFDEGTIWTSVQSVEDLSEKQTVYNLSVLEENTYGANDFMVHNCGALSSNKGEDFRIVLEETAKIIEPDAVIPGPPKGKWRTAGTIVGDGWSIAWRVLDAQYWGVPQRRRRIALVADFGGQSASEVLFESKSVSRDIEQGEKEEQTDSTGTGNSTDPAVWCIQGNCIGRSDNAGPCGKGWKEDVSYTLNTVDQHVVAIPINDKATRYQGGGPTRHGDGAGNGLGIGHDGDPSPTLTAGDRHSVAVFDNHGKDGRLAGPVETSPTVCKYWGTGGNNTPIVMDDKTLAVHQNASGECRINPVMGTMGTNSNPSGRNTPIVLSFHLTQDPITSEDRTPCLSSGSSTGQASVGVMCMATGQANAEICNNLAPTLIAGHEQPILCLNDQGGAVMGVSEDVTGTLRAQEHGHQPIVCAAVDCRNITENESVNGTLQSKKSGGYTLNAQNVVRNGACLRRLTPIECERLQGYPDKWTDIGTWVDSNGKTHKESSDSARYKALGNSIALPPWRWILKRISEQYDYPPTMASLFDGISGFPLIWTEINGADNVLWTSEIDEFPIAVCRYHFGAED